MLTCKYEDVTWIRDKKVQVLIIGDSKLQILFHRINQMASAVHQFKMLRYIKKVFSHNGLISSGCQNFLQFRKIGETSKAGKLQKAKYRFHRPL